MQELRDEKTGAHNILALAAKVAARVQIQDVKLLRFSAERQASLPQGPLFVTYSASPRTQQLAEKILVVVLDFTMGARLEDVASADRIVDIRATVELTYKCDDTAGLDERALDCFGRINGPYNAWPYWREFVQSSVARMGLPTLVVPTFRLPRPARSLGEKKEGEGDGASSEGACT